ncbi:alpha/beta hydrolase [Rarobacter incanus]|uniref:Alpha-beta hydrolase superfamily lysophospholipase n=1 Tax=Rarobacter incanus TaxID=153494 RepID=A0A542SS25_9MICO|nr:alpha/beta hydrolase [Rarobacter incanus]TQK77384.1 alpha-beta hydrolase superfamily lysophospholipase [Rarobacter incanus]
MDTAQANGWSPDILGPGFEALTLDLRSDDEGPVVATLVRSLPSAPQLRHLRPVARPLDDVDILYIHGWSDYFFQTQLARFFTDRGARFFALDLRKYGRSLRPGQTAGFITDLTEYDEDIEAALTVIKQDLPPGTKPRRLIPMGHSTGGLIWSLWVARHPGAASALILNSPWLEFQLSATVRTAIAPIVNLQASLTPHNAAPNIDFGFYARAQRACADPAQPMVINEAWRPEHTTAVRAAWLKAILVGHATVQAGLDIKVPICVLLSEKFAPPTRWSDQLTRCDTVLVVDEIAKAALKLGQTVTVNRISGAIHDVFLSRRKARADAYRRMEDWFSGVAARPEPGARRAFKLPF